MCVHQSNTKTTSTKFHEKILNRSQEKEERKKTLKNGQNNPKSFSPGVGDRFEFFIFVTTSEMPQSLICKVSEKNTQSFSKNGGTYIQGCRQTDKLKQTVSFD